MTMQVHAETNRKNIDIKQIKRNRSTVKTFSNVGRQRYTIDDVMRKQNEIIGNTKYKNLIVKRSLCSDIKTNSFHFLINLTSSPPSV